MSQILIKVTKRFGKGPICNCGNNTYNKQLRIKDFGIRIERNFEWKCTNCLRTLDTGPKEGKYYVILDKE